MFTADEVTLALEMLKHSKEEEAKHLAHNKLRAQRNGTKMQARNLWAGDVIQLIGGAGYTVATVCRVEDDAIEVLRPYVSTSDVLYSGGRVIATLGFEKCELQPDIEFLVIQSGELLR